MNKKIFGILIVLIVLTLLYASSAHAVMTGHVTVTWNNVISTFYSIEVCIEDTSIFDSFESLILVYSKYDRTNSPQPADATFAQKTGNKWCSDLNGNLWDSTPPVDTLLSAKIVVKDRDVTIFKSDSWYTDVPNNMNNPNHIFYGSGVDCVDNDGDGFYNISALCQTGNDCDDGNVNVNPGASDAVCDGIDNNCDLQIDEDYVVAPTSCGVGACADAGQLQCVNGNEVDTCMPETPTEEICGDGIDNDCVDGDATCPAPPSGSDSSGNEGNDGGSGGGRGGIYRCANEWQCDEWSECADELQTRTCNFVELNPKKLSTKLCDKESSPPEIKRKCQVNNKQSEEKVETCFDGIKSQNEENIDCGGVCKPCDTIKKTKSETDNPNLKSISRAAVSEVEKPNFAVGIVIILIIVSIGVYVYVGFNKKL